MREALDKIKEHLGRQHSGSLDYSARRTGVNEYLNKLGMQIIRFDEWKTVYQKCGSALGKLSSLEFLELANVHRDRFDEVYGSLVDRDSKETFNWYVQYRTAYAFIGDEAYELFTPAITRQDWAEMEKRIRRKSRGVYEIGDFTIDTRNIGDLIGTFCLEQYRYKDIVEPAIGEVVLDIGASVGDTSLWFSKKVGSTGKVYAFEPEPKNFQILLGNIEQNNVKNVTPLNIGLSDREGRMKIVSGGSASFLAESEGEAEVTVTTIDEFVRDNKLPKVDFIKMDVEGHEMNVLRGANETMRAFKPKMALSAYHRGDDLVTLPKLLITINEDYKFYLGHFAPSWTDTVLFATISA